MKTTDKATSHGDSPESTHTDRQFADALGQCRRVFAAKLQDYGPSWRILRLPALTDQLLIKALRIRNLEEGRANRVGEGILPELMGLVNYSIIGLIQMGKKAVTEVDITPEEALRLYDHHTIALQSLLSLKNHDYDEAWRQMRPLSYTDLILSKLQRIKQIEDHKGRTYVSEGVDANYMDIAVYAAFGIIRATEGTEPESPQAGK